MSPRRTRKTRKTRSFSLSSPTVEGPGVGKDHKEVMQLCGFAVLQLCDPTSSPLGRGRGWVKTIKKLCIYAVLRFCSYVIPQAPLLGGAGGWVKTVKKLCSYAVLRFCSYAIPQAPLPWRGWGWVSLFSNYKMPYLYIVSGKIIADSGKIIIVKQYIFYIFTCNKILIIWQLLSTWMSCFQSGR